MVGNTFTKAPKILNSAHHPINVIQINLVLDQRAQVLLQLYHVGRVLLGGEEQAQLQAIRLRHHLADQLVVGEHRGTAE